jgi:hypothetical protein
MNIFIAKVIVYNLSLTSPVRFFVFDPVTQ